MATFSLIFFLYAFQKQVLSIPKVYFINKLLIIQVHFKTNFHKLFSKLFSNYFQRVQNFVSHNLQMYMDMFIYFVRNADIFSGIHYIIHFFWCNSFIMFKQSKGNISWLKFSIKMVKVLFQNNKNWASYKCLVRKSVNNFPKNWMWNSRNGTSCAAMYLSFTV